MLQAIGCRHFAAVHFTFSCILHRNFSAEFHGQTETYLIALQCAKNSQTVISPNGQFDKNANVILDAAS